MYQPGELLIYGSAGVYRVEEVAPIRHIRGYDPNKDYYKLTSVRRGEITYVPVDSSVFMRPVIGREEAERLLAGAGELKANICMSRDPRTLREHYQAVLATHDCRELMGLIKGVNAKGRMAAAQGKRPGKTDQDYKKRAEMLLNEELSVALGESTDQVQSAVAAALAE